jgi:RND family efflux transporter MFP subunit
VTRRGIDTGHLTTPGASGELLFIVARSDIVTITVGIPETDAPFVNAGDQARVRLQALEGKTFEGKVTRTAWALDAATRTLRTEIDLPNSGDLLRPGLYAYAIIISEEHKNALTLPATAIVRDGEKPYCLTVVDGRAKRSEITLGIVDGKRSEIVSGLKGGERVVEANAASLADGQPVEENKAQAEASKPKT